MKKVIGRLVKCYGLGMLGIISCYSYAATTISGGGGDSASPDQTGITSSGDSIAQNISFKINLYNRVNITSGTDINSVGDALISGDFKARAGNKIIFHNNLKVQNNAPGRIAVGRGIDIKNSFFAYPGEWIISAYVDADKGLKEMMNRTITVGENWYGTTGTIASLDEIPEYAADNNIWITLPNQQWDNGNKNDDGSVGTLTGMTINVSGKAYGYTRIRLPEDKLLGDIFDENGISKYSPPVVTVAQGSFVSPEDETLNNFAFYGKATVNAENKLVYLRLAPGTNTADNATAHYVWGWLYDNNSNSGSYTEDTASILFAPQLSQELAFSSIDRRHNRIGETDTREGNTWLRLLGQTTKLGSHQFRSKLSSVGIQIGHDLKKEKVDDENMRLGVVATYQAAKANFYDNFSINPLTLTPHFAKVGKDSINFYSLGFYRTKDRDWGYTDYVGQVYLAEHNLKSVNQTRDKLKAYGVSLSAEVGYNLYQRNAWLLQAQGQAIYQLNQTNLISNKEYQVSYHDDSQIRLRGGIRLEYSKFAKDRDSKLWLTADILKDLFPNNKVGMGTSQLSLNLPRTWLDIGIGGDWAVGKDLYLYSALHRELSWQSHLSRSNLKGNLGVKYLF
ncbi:hypothetical protein QV06_06335 [Gallibacterium genomosp. 3]|uniref:Autotransporter domain-containing protein n=1 Tax=Gallibacterium genomosp. 3 TaxID=505345 RepID=A0A1A7PR39_9PAST|nr:autotransporter domain-containing protein [Gallibacterium genomosp. 3]OBX04514.1 hypothetical protein QV06_06335 [Gallibacterium genomosp. 3]